MCDDFPGSFDGQFVTQVGIQQSQNSLAIRVTDVDNFHSSLSVSLLPYDRWKPASKAKGAALPFFIPEHEWQVVLDWAKWACGPAVTDATARSQRTAQLPTEYSPRCK